LSLHSVALQPALALGGVLTAVAALAHVGCIVFGAPWYRFFGAGERMARMADAGQPMAAIVTAAIAGVLALWAAYAFSAAGLLPRMPWPKLALSAITGVYLLRGLAGIGVALFVAKTEQGTPFWWWSSAICLGLGLLHAWGLSRVWERL
jgi:hypothetical protein